MNKKILKFILPIFVLCSCGESNSTNEEDSEGITNGNEPGLTHDAALTESNIFEHIDYDISWKYDSTTDSKNNRVYSSKFCLEVYPLRKGFVSYNLNAKLTFKLAWKTSTNSYAFDKSTFLTKLIKLEYGKSNFIFVKEYTTTSSSPAEEIPYNVSYSFSEDFDPSCLSVSVSDVIGKATYYNYGISGDRSLTYKSYEITTLNYSFYLETATESNTKYSYIRPINGNALYDYRINLRINKSNMKITLRRDGYYFFNRVIENLEITSVNGFIDVYPGRTI